MKKKYINYTQNDYKEHLKMCSTIISGVLKRGDFSKDTQYYLERAYEDLQNAIKCYDYEKNEE